MHIQIEDLQKQYQGQVVLDIPGLSIEPGELTGIVGNNGAGKTTLLRLTLDLIAADQGRIILGEEAVQTSSHWKLHTGSFLDEGFLIGFLTPQEYFHFNGQTYGKTTEEVEEALKPFERFLGEEICGTSKYIRQLSTGNKQKVGIVAAMMVNPSLLLLDEPFNFLDPSSQIVVRKLLKEINTRQGTTMLISSHNINHLAEICTRVILLEKGKIIKDIRPQTNGELNEIEHYFDSQAQ